MSQFKEPLRIPRYVVIVSSVLLICSFLVNLFQVKTFFVKSQSHSMQFDDSGIISNISNYLDTIAPAYITDVKQLAKERGIPSWGCGPSSYAIGQIINKKFLNNRFIIDASYDNKPYEIVERFGFAIGNPTGEVGVTGVDHAWLEIYFKDKFLFIDPTVEQFGKNTGIAHEVFKIGDPAIGSILQEKYGILDIRMSILVKKAINRIPVSQEPYPNQGISQSDLAYYLKSLDDRDQVNEGKLPDNWKEWVTNLIQKYE